MNISAVTSVRNGVEEKKSSDLTNKLIPNSSEVSIFILIDCSFIVSRAFDLENIVLLVL